ncbi:MAG: deoxyguanosinetriphosphate triphosphohydrolase [Clostridia bacterium]
MKENWIAFEREFLSPYAAKSENSKGRLVPIESCPLRTEFQRDRDRILHSKSFRRLKHKTQVFLSPTGDHYRTRLTHTLEVTQIARTISRALRLNEDLTEAIALGHDLGHTPFGHTGERVLAAKTGHFFHNEQSLRMVNFLEEDGRGLNLTFEVRDGILNHKSDGNPATLEGRVVGLADRIAYLNHDIDDAIRAGLMSKADIPSEVASLLGTKKGQMINSLVTDIIKMSKDKPLIEQSAEYSEVMSVLHDFMTKNIYTKSAAKVEEKKADRLISLLYDYFCEHPEEVPSLYKIHTTEKSVFITDYIAGMTDNFAVKIFESIFVPKSWSI